MRFDLGWPLGPRRGDAVETGSSPGRRSTPSERVYDAAGPFYSGPMPGGIGLPAVAARDGRHPRIDGIQRSERIPVIGRTADEKQSDRLSPEPAWEERLAEVRGVRSIDAAMPGTRRYRALFSPRRIGKSTASNSIKYAACSVSNFNNPRRIDHRAGVPPHGSRGPHRVRNRHEPGCVPRPGGLRESVCSPTLDRRGSFHSRLRPDR